MKKNLWIVALLLTLAPAFARAGSVEQALSALANVEADVRGLSAVKQPGLNNVEQVRGELSVLQPFLGRLGESLVGLDIGPAEEVRSVSLDISAKIDGVKQNSQVDLNVFIQKIQGIGMGIDNLKALLPELRAQLERAVPALQQGAAALATVFPTPLPAGLLPPSSVANPTPSLFVYTPTAVPTTQRGNVAQATPTPGASIPGVIPGGSMLPPLPMSTPLPALIGPQPSTTPRGPWRAPVPVVQSRNGSVAWIANTQEGTVVLFDTGVRRFVATIATGRQPVALALDQSGAWLLVANAGANTLSMVDTGTRKKALDVKVGVTPVDVVLQPNGKKAYVVNSGSNTVTVVDLAKRAAIKTIKVGLAPARAAFSANGGTLLVTNSGDDSVTVIDTGIDEAVATVEEE